MIILCQIVTRARVSMLDSDFDAERTVEERIQDPVSSAQSLHALSKWKCIEGKSEMLIRCGTCGFSKIQFIEHAVRRTTRRRCIYGHLVGFVHDARVM